MAPFAKYFRKFSIWCWYTWVVIQPTASSEGRREHRKTLDEKPPTLESEMGCWVFHHMPKSGGSTVKAMFSKAAKTNNIPQPAVGNPQYIRGARARRKAENALRDGRGMMFGGYVETVRPSQSEDKCKWFTVFRHPVARVISAYFYCRFKGRKDSPCNHQTINLGTIDILGFAKHWGNFGLRQFVLSYYSADKIISTPKSRACKRCAGWYMVKRYLEDLQQQSTDNITTPLGQYQNDDLMLYRFLEPALETISSRYAAVGVLEDFNTTMYLFDRALGIPNFSWAVESQRVGARNSDDKKKAEENDALVKFSTDPSLKKFIWLDIILYEHALSVHAKQLKEYGLE